MGKEREREGGRERERLREIHAVRDDDYFLLFLFLHFIPYCNNILFCDFSLINYYKVFSFSPVKVKKNGERKIKKTNC